MYPMTVYVHPWRSLKNVTNVELHTNALFLPKGQTLRRLDLCFAVKRRGRGGKLTFQPSNICGIRTPCLFELKR